MLTQTQRQQTMENKRIRRNNRLLNVRINAIQRSAVRKALVAQKYNPDLMPAKRQGLFVRIFNIIKLLFGYESRRTTGFAA